MCLTSTDHLSRPAGNALLNAAQGALGLRYKDMLWAYVQLVRQDPQGLFSRAAFQSVSPSLYWCLGLFISWDRTLHYMIDCLLQLELDSVTLENLFSYRF